MDKIQTAYQLAQERYAELGVDTGAALKTLAAQPVSLPCWQGDDVGGFEKPGARLSGSGLQATGNFPGKARTITELRQDLLKALSLIPGRHRVNLHSTYGEFGARPVERDQFALEHFAGWIDWARQNALGLDFNATLFSHPKAASGFTLSSKDDAVRRFWVEHVRRCRDIAAGIGQALASDCLHNLWIPDGMKDFCVDRAGYRRILLDSLDELYARHPAKPGLKDSLEPKLFGIGSEYCVYGSMEFYLSYALGHKLMLCLDTGHFHPTESVADKLSSILLFSPELALHVSRGVRWDSDHVPVLDDSLRELCLEIVRADALGRVRIGLDFFDASINRVGAWVIGARAVLKALLAALLEPRQELIEYEEAGNYFARLALLEQARTLPLGAVWDHYCAQNNVPADGQSMESIMSYERETLARRT